MSGALIPLLMLLIAAWGVFRRVDLYDALVTGMKQGLRVCIGIFPAMLTMLVAIAMLRASGAVDLLGKWLAPLLEPLGIPRDCFPLVLLRPFSGTGALAVGSEIMARVGPDSTPGRIAAVMLGSSETTFYTLAVYSAYLRMRDTGCTVPAALCGDAAAFLLSGMAVRLFFH